MNHIIIGILFSLSYLLAHCQVPCGIYDDAARIIRMEEDIQTIEKAMLKIHELSDKGDMSSQDQNQLVRWINTKEQHAQKIQDTMAEYFLAQRIYPKNDSEKGYDEYVLLTTQCQKIIFQAMKTKQTVDPEWVEKLISALNGLVNIYFDDHGKDHLNHLRY